MLIRLYIDKPLVTSDYIVVPKSWGKLNIVTAFPKLRVLKAIVNTVSKIVDRQFSDKEYNYKLAVKAIILADILNNNIWKLSKIRTVLYNRLDLIKQSSIDEEITNNAFEMLASYNPAIFPGTLLELLVTNRKEYDKIKVKLTELLDKIREKYGIDEEEIQKAIEEQNVQQILDMIDQVLQDMNAVIIPPSIQSSASSTSVTSNTPSQSTPNIQNQPLAQPNTSVTPSSPPNTSQGSTQVTSGTPTQSTSSIQSTSGTVTSNLPQSTSGTKQTGNGACQQASSQGAVPSHSRGQSGAQSALSAQGGQQASDNIASILSEYVRISQDLDQQIHQYMTAQNPLVITKIRSSIEAMINASKVYKQLIESVTKTAIYRRIEKIEGKYKPMGSSAQGLYGNATAELEFDKNELEEIKAPSIEEMLYKKVKKEVEGKRKKIVSSWLRKDYRTGLYPGTYLKKKKGVRAIFGVDVSGSMSALELASIIKALKEAFESDIEGEIVLWSTVVEKVLPLKEVDKLKKEMPAGGGTDPLAFFNYVEYQRQRNKKKYKEYYAIVLLTDGVWGVSKELEQALKDAVKKYDIALAVITKDEETAEILKKLGWKVIYFNPYEDEEGDKQ